MKPSEFRKHQLALIDEVCDERDSLRIENARLRGALEWIADQAPATQEVTRMSMICDAAQEALFPSDPKSPQGLKQERDALSIENALLLAMMRKVRAYISIAATHNKSVMAARLLLEIDAVIDPILFPNAPKVGTLDSKNQ